MKSRELIFSSMVVMLVLRVEIKVVSSVFVAVLIEVEERLTEVMETAIDSIEVDVVDSATVSVNIVILLISVTSSTVSPLELPVLVPAKIDDTRVVTSVRDFLFAESILHSARMESSGGTSLLLVLTPSGSDGALPAPKISSSLALLPVSASKDSWRDVTTAEIFTERASILSFDVVNDVFSVSVNVLTLAVIIVRAIDVILTEAKSSWVIERNSETTEIKAVAVISSVPELDPPDITVVNVSVTLVTALLVIVSSFISIRMVSIAVSLVARRLPDRICVGFAVVPETDSIFIWRTSFIDTN